MGKSHVACLLIMFFNGRLAMPILDVRKQGTPRLFSAPSVSGLCKRMAWEWSSIMIVQCPYCHYKEAVPEEYAGMIGECSNCGKDFKIVNSRVLQRANTEGEHPAICFLFSIGFLF